MMLIILFFGILFGFTIASWCYSTFEKENLLHEVCELLDLPYGETELDKKLRIRKIEREK